MSAQFSSLLQQIIFYLFALMAVLCAALVVFNRNPVRSILFLVLTFFATAAVWIMLQAEFLGLILIVVYVGAVMTLFLFVVMMLDLDMISRHRGLVRAWPLALLVVIVILAGLIAFVGPWHFGRHAFVVPAAVGADYSSTAVLGMSLYNKFLLPFELAGVLLLVGMIAAISLTKRDQLRRHDQQVANQVRVQASDRLKIVKDEEIKK